MRLLELLAGGHPTARLWFARKEALCWMRLLGTAGGGKAEGDWGLSTNVKLVSCRTSACWPVSVVALVWRCRLFRYRLVE